MPYHGRLIWPQKVRIAQRATVATPMDDDFREPALVSAGAGPGALARDEVLTGYIPAQVEVVKFGELRQAYAGNLPAGSIVLVFDARTLGTLGYLDADGESKLKIGDRLEGIYAPNTLALIQRPSLPMYAVEARPGSFGLSGLSRNLMLLAFAPRDQGALSPP